MKIISYETSCYKSTLIFETEGQLESMEFPVSTTLEEAINELNTTFQDDSQPQLITEDVPKKNRSSNKTKDKK